jgi:hypothetical protein
MQIRDFIKLDDLILPDWLFYLNSSRKNTIPSTAELIVEAAVEQGKTQAFQASTAPSQDINKKTIIIDKNTFSKEKEIHQKIAWIKRLKLAGFDITLCIKEQFINIDDKLTNIVSYLKNLRNFNNNYQELGVAKDRAILMTVGRMSDVIYCFEQNPYSYFNCWGNSWQLQQRVIDLTSIIELAKLTHFESHSFAEIMDLYFSYGFYLPVNSSNYLNCPCQDCVNEEKRTPLLSQEPEFINLFSSKDFYYLVNRRLDLGRIFLTGLLNWLGSNKLSCETLLSIINNYPPELYEFIKESFIDKIDNSDPKGKLFNHLRENPNLFSITLSLPYDIHTLIGAIILFPNHALNILKAHNQSLDIRDFQQLAKVILADQKETFNFLTEKVVEIFRSGALLDSLDILNSKQQFEALHKLLAQLLHPSVLKIIRFEHLIELLERVPLNEQAVVQDMIRDKFNSQDSLNIQHLGKTFEQLRLLLKVLSLEAQSKFDPLVRKFDSFLQNYETDEQINSMTLEIQYKIAAFLIERNVGKFKPAIEWFLKNCQSALLIQNEDKKIIAKEIFKCVLSILNEAHNLDESIKIIKSSNFENLIKKISLATLEEHY